MSRGGPLRGGFYHARGFAGWWGFFERNRVGPAGLQG